MKHSDLLRSSFIVAALIFFKSSLLSQDCFVEKDSLKGTYTGDCKKGKASGKGKAVGADTYEGEFKSGLPDGQGTYTWSNGNTFKGGFDKGQRNGSGAMVYKRPEKPDSVVEGFWKKDVYVGKHEYQYKLLFKSKKITNVNISYKKDVGNQITLWVSNTSAGSRFGSGANNGKIEISNILLTSGNYSRSYTTNTYSTKTETILYDASYPIRMQIVVGSETVEVELFEEGSYTVDIQINL